MPQSGVEVDAGIKSKQPHSQPTLSVPEAARYKRAIVRGQVHHIAVGRLALNSHDSGVEHPGMAAEEGPSPLGFEKYRCSGQPLAHRWREHRSRIIGHCV